MSDRFDVPIEICDGCETVCSSVVGGEPIACGNGVQTLNGSTCVDPGC